MSRVRARALLAPVLCASALAGPISAWAGGAAPRARGVSGRARAVPAALAVPARSPVRPRVDAVPGARMVATAAVAPARLHVSFVPDLPGRRTTVELSLRLVTPAGVAPPALSGFALRLPAGMGIATTTLGEANCSAAALLAHGLRGCSPDALLGYGSATAAIPNGTEAIAERASLYPLMGPPAENRIEVLFYIEAQAPVFAQLVLPATLTEGDPRLGERLETSVPVVQTWPEGPDLSLQTFSSTLGPLRLTYRRRVGGRTVAFHPRGIRIPSVCPPGGYPFNALLRFLDGSSTTATYDVPCVHR